MNHMPWQCARPSRIIFVIPFIRASERNTVLRDNNIVQSKHSRVTGTAVPLANELVQIGDGLFQDHEHAAGDGVHINQLQEKL